MIRDNVIWKYKNIARAVGYSEAQLKIALKRARIRLLMHKKSIYVYKSQITCLAMRLWRWNENYRLLICNNLIYNCRGRYAKRHGYKRVPTRSTSYTTEEDGTITIS